MEYREQTRLEGELQNLPDAKVHAELWELVGGSKPGRVNNHEITLFDAVGYALEDFSALRLIYRLAAELGIGRELDLLPALADPKNLFGLTASPNTLETSSRMQRKVS